MTRAEILNCLTDRPCEVCKFHSDGHCSAWNCVFEEKPDDAEDCEDAISRQAVLDDLERSHITSGVRNQGTWNECIDSMMRTVKSIPSVTPKQRTGQWIPVSERLPEPYGHVLRTVKSIGWNGTFSIYVDIGTICPIDTDVIAWMPLPVPMIPEPYKAESEDTE